MKRTLLIYIISFCAFFFSIGEANAQYIRISGVVIDDLTKEALVGANVIVDSLFIGAATDVNGKFEISGIPNRPFDLVVKFIGYENKRISLKTQPTQPLTIGLSSTSIVGEEVLITALARGQMGAINRQLNALQMKSVVSAAKMDEIPDATAAEAIGRLPGLSIERSGGEANKVSVRGLGSKYTTVAIEGITLLSTDANNRSVDISMIVPNVLSGVEVTKSTTSDMIASSMGGAVDMSLKTAQDGDLFFDASAQAGYNSNISSMSDYKVTISSGKRFFDNKLGLMFGGYLENRYLGRDIVDPAWIRDDRISDAASKDSTLRLNKMNYSDIDDNRFRFGGSLVIDYKLPFGQIKLINFGSRMNQETTTYNQSFDVISDWHTWSTEIGGTDYRTQFVNKIAGEFNLFTGKLSAGFSHSMAERNNPERVRVGGWGNFQNHPQMGNVKYRDSLSSIPGFEFDKWVNFINVDGENSKDYLHQSAGNIDFIKNYGLDREFTTQLDYQIPFAIQKITSGFVKIGYMRKIRTRKYDMDQNKVDVASSGINRDVDVAIRKHFPDIYVTDPSYQGKIEPKDAWSDDFDLNNFFGGDYYLFPFMSHDHLIDYANYGRQYYQENGHNLYPNISSFMRDHDGRETYNAAYVMAEIKFFKEMVSIIPGIRYERQTYQYTADSVTAPFGGSAADLTTYVSSKTSDEIVHENFFPTVQAIIRPFDWVDLRLAYNRTVARPDFYDILPRFSYDPNTTPGAINAGNTNLRPQLSENLDAMITFHGNRFGLFSVGIYKKDITDMIVNNTYLLLNTEQTAYHGLPDVVVSKERGGKARYTYSLNNEWMDNIKGIEFDYQPNLHFLPFPFNGILFNSNVTINDREFTRYNYTIDKVMTPLFPGSPIKVPKDFAIDTFAVFNYTSFTLNASLGYAYKGFTANVSYLYKPESIRSLSSTRITPTEDLYNLPYNRIDVKIKQRLNSGLEIFLNINNLTNSGEDYFRNVAGAGRYYTEYLEKYGRNFHLGLRYRL